ncbi:JADE1 protein, partial [Nothoprocta pentlandii]|nr:JADE1 protein [Nothoprocta pentlandii]
VRNLTYMVTRREKIKRSVCRVQEQIFNAYAKQLEQERVSGVPCSSSSVESVVLFNSPSLGPDAPKIEDLKWHSAFFRKQLGTSLGHPARKALRSSGGSGGAGRRAGPTGKALQPPGTRVHGPLAEARLAPAPPSNGLVVPEHRKRRDDGAPGEGARAELKEKPPKHNHKALRPAELSQRHSENRRAPGPASARTAPGTRRDLVPKCNG